VRAEIGQYPHFMLQVAIASNRGPKKKKEKRREKNDVPIDRICIR
jgi:hypothetical protein